MHTPGPWKVHIFADKAHFVTAGVHDQIPIANTGRWDMASAFDARLIAAAPELLEACKQCREQAKFLLVYPEELPRAREIRRHGQNIVDITGPVCDIDMELL